MTTIGVTYNRAFCTTDCKWHVTASAGDDGAAETERLVREHASSEGHCVKIVKYIEPISTSGQQYR